MAEASEVHLSADLERQEGERAQKVGIRSESMTNSIARSACGWRNKRGEYDMDPIFFDDGYRDMKMRQRRLLDEAQQYRLASQGRGARGGTWTTVVRLLSWIRCRAGLWAGRSSQQPDRESAPPALQGSDIPC